MDASHYVEIAKTGHSVPEWNDGIDEANSNYFS